MGKKDSPPVSTGIPLSDPRRPLKLRRLREEFDRLPGFLSREPQLRDPEFTEWEGTVASLLIDLFGSSSLLVRFRQLRIRAVSHRMGGPPQWIGNPKEAWKTGLESAAKILREALEEADVLTGIEPEKVTATLDAAEAAWDLLHPSVRAISNERFRSGHYADSVEAAIKELQAIIRKLVIQQGGPELDGVPLMHQAFSPTKPIVVLADLASQTGRNMQRGYMDMFAGVVAAIRNPHAHGNVAIPKERALHQLFVVSTLWYAFDERP